MNAATSAVTRTDVEKTLWMASGWQADQRYVDTVMAKVDAYAAGAPEPAGVDMAAVSDQAQEILDQARAEAERIVAMARFEASVLGASVDDPNRRRKCSTCGAVKPGERFGRDSRSVGGRRKQCKDCDNVTKRKRYAAKGKQVQS
jgi:hypothetical protein